MRWATLGRWVIVGAASALAGGCGLLVGFPDRTLASGEGGGGASAISSSSGMGGDGSSASSGGGGGQGGAPATVTSTGSASSSSATSSTSTGGVLTYCDGLSPKPLFCDDFEHDSLAMNGWKLDIPANAKVATTTQQSTPPGGHSLEIGITGGSGENVGLASRLVQGTYSSMTLAFDMYMDKLPVMNTIAYVAELQLASDLGALIYVAESGTVKIQQKTPPNNFDHDIGAALGIKAKQWTHVELTLALASGAPTVTLSIDTNKVIDAMSLQSAFVPGTGTVVLGNIIDKDSTPRSVFYDNVVFTAQ